MSTLEEATQPLVVPLATQDGVIRVAGTRVSLESVLIAFKGGCTPEEIVQQYPSLPLADVYTAIAYYLRNRPEIDSYLAQQTARREQVERDLDARYGLREMRERLLARRNNE
jgi:uncharacterized protein (DUF433 family)